MAVRSVGIGLNLFGFLGWVERAGFYEPLALNAAIIAYNTGKLSQGTRRIAECSDGFWSVYRYGIFFRFALEMRGRRSHYGFLWVPFPSCLCRFGRVRAASGGVRFDCLITHLLCQVLRFQH